MASESQWAPTVATLLTPLGIWDLGSSSPLQAGGSTFSGELFGEWSYTRGTLANYVCDRIENVAAGLEAAGGGFP